MGMRIEFHDVETTIQEGERETVIHQIARTVVVTPSCHCDVDGCDTDECTDCGGCLICCRCLPGEG